MPFTYNRTIRFQDTDAAGVVYFANVLSICHEAYEESLAIAGINLKTFFSHSGTAIPIIHTSVDFFAPMFCGDKLLIHLTPQELGDTKFEISYEIVADSSSQVKLAKALTRHVCINPITRTRTPFPEEIVAWLRKS
ncbi:MAG TPA: 1,4-dihydroxy-2-naphthoyl-CoA hydrolase [Cyanobacteria bacterium UBA11149]|nr:1,4-dihydroxy-2-naphthoyl-CoA hydrolase [Cyanobacteria bacterium UBA11367]HBE60902.1 1,4-dihydroxy-2-naphthoyl-CoA hydrolase [Cyanobacteria bacterium UBA11366]HBK62877.1 1,4-dihydroxy-2-naphthoyl-CoA hydrolase [Cyanobacteria bacterium UBA11166]HBR76610.1 1,4-dihydroxy-2-naphthoyl-CoA hydrolase [Cyanobacteria bacterium UBA11159]HBS72371.1 1,4-dihydroxy-2-naphthoyl-CoA hydrolase [Cyanobacteria bacterium UBA11153]HBW92078.1 1,4-dihydroxy-2-naphthoyl-CoA hydrolase [Cyanobacteria bacterium UBA11